MNSASPQSDFRRSETDIPEIPLISIVDDDESVREALRSLIESVGYRAEVFSSGEDFLNSGSFSDTDCLIVDVRMPGMNGLELQERLNAVHSLIPVIFISAHDDGEARSRALRAGAVDFLQKPFSEDALLGAIGVCLRMG
jgi:FixJ family two-component response regulator